MGPQWAKRLTWVVDHRWITLLLVGAALLVVYVHWEYWRRQKPDKEGAAEPHVHHHYQHAGKFMKVGNQLVPARPVTPAQIAEFATMRPLKETGHEIMKRRMDKKWEMLSRISREVLAHPEWDFHTVDAHLWTEPEYHELERFMPKLEDSTLYLWSPMGGAVHPRVHDVKRAIEQFEQSLRI